MLAIAGSEYKFIKCDPAMGVPVCQTRTVVKWRMKLKHQQRQDDLVGHTEKKSCPKFSANLTEET